MTAFSGGVETEWRERAAWKEGRAREMRERPTRAEAVLWGKLAEGQVCGAKFRRQVVLNGYIADFYCGEAKLVVEVDGGYHRREGGQEWDKHRDEALAAELKLLTLRFTNERVLNEIGWVVEAIATEIRRRRGVKPRRERRAVRARGRDGVEGEARGVWCGARVVGRGMGKNRPPAPKEGKKELMGPLGPPLNPLKAEHEKQYREALESYRSGRFYRPRGERAKSKEKKRRQRQARRKRLYRTQAAVGQAMNGAWWGARG